MDSDQTPGDATRVASFAQSGDFSLAPSRHALLLDDGNVGG